MPESRVSAVNPIEGRNIILEFRFTAGDISRSRQLAAELVALPVDVLVPEGTGTYALGD